MYKCFLMLLLAGVFMFGCGNPVKDDFNAKDGNAGFMATEVQDFTKFMQKMNEKKDLFAVEDDYFYLILRYVIYDKRERIRSLSPQDLYKLMVDNAEEMKLKDFQKYYKSPMSMAKHLANIKGELEREFTMDIFTRADHQREYSLGPTEDQDHDFLISAEQLMDALGMDPSQAKIAAS